MISMQLRFSRCLDMSPAAARLLSLLILLIFLFPRPAPAASRGIDLTVKTPGGGSERIPLYRASHALLVGVADYTSGWPDLTSIPGEMDQLEKALQGQGFNVVKVLNPDRKTLTGAFEDFIDQYGLDRDNRLLFFFSGHGYSRSQAEKGYIVPADAPSPLEDEKGFVRKAVEMEQIVTWARRIESKHALFLFDSCFSGTVFQSRALPAEPPHISAMAARPVRQFISAGSAGEEIPATSFFVPSFIRALEGEGDIDGDGYITGTELGMFLHRKVTGYQVGQTPQYGKIRDPRLDQGDFVLLAGQSMATTAKTDTGTLALATDPAGAAVLIDGRPHGHTPVTIEGLAAGRVQVRIDKDGYRLHEETILIRKNRTVPLNIVLTGIHSGSLEVVSEPAAASWYLNGAYVGVTPDSLPDLEPGEYEVTVQAPGFQEWAEVVLVEDGQVSRVDAQLLVESAGGDEAGQTGGSIEELKAIVQQDPANRRAWVQLGNAYFGADLPPLAVQAYQKALELDPLDANVLTDLGVMQRNMGQQAESIESMRKALIIDPEHQQAMFNLGVLYRYDQKDDRKAYYYWEKFLAAHPDSPAADQVRAELASLKGKVKPARLAPPNSCTHPKAEIRMAATVFEAFYADHERYPHDPGETKWGFEAGVTIDSFLMGDGNFVLTATSDRCDRIYVRHATRMVIDELLK